MTDMTNDLKVSPSKLGTDADIHWRTQHNRAVIAYTKDRMGAINDLRRCERAILSLIAGLEQWIGSNAEFVDPWSGEFVVHQVADGIGNALNLDLGRLDGGTLSTYVHGLCKRAGVDPDTGEQL